MSNYMMFFLTFKLKKTVRSETFGTKKKIDRLIWHNKKITVVLKNSIRLP